MTALLKTYFDFNYIYKTACSYIPTNQTLNLARTFLWNNKEVIVASTAIGTVLLKIIRYIKNRPQMPDVELKSTLNFATLSIKIPKEEYPPPNVTLTFCIDVSGSMDTVERGDEVKRALCSLLEDAQQVVDKSAEANISIAITAFTKTSRVIIPLEKLISNKESQAIKHQLKHLQFSGGTNILEGLAGATEQLKTAARVNKTASHFIILLTDGENGLDEERLSSIQANIASTSAKLFAIGIGKKHSKDTLRKIATNGRFEGIYIDTTSGKDPIGSTISKIYNQAIASFYELELTSAQLGLNTWSVIKTPSVIENGQSKCKLGSLSEGEILNKSIVIHPDRLSAPLDLSTVKFSLNFKDPKGRQSQLSLPWNPTAIIDPTIVLAAHC